MLDGDDRPRPRVIGGYKRASTLHPSARHASIFARSVSENGRVRCEVCGLTVNFSEDTLSSAVQVPDDWYIATAETGTYPNGSPIVGGAPVCPSCVAPEAANRYETAVADGWKAEQG